MAETKSAERQRDQAAQKVTVTNMYRDQPILFHVTGGSVRLGPLETRELDPACLASPEVSHLVQAGILRVHEVEKQDAENQDDRLSGHRQDANRDPDAEGSPTEDERDGPRR